MFCDAAIAAIYLQKYAKHFSIPNAGRLFGLRACRHWVGKRPASGGKNGPNGLQKHGLRRRNCNPSLELQKPSLELTDFRLKLPDFSLGFHLYCEAGNFFFTFHWGYGGFAVYLLCNGYFSAFPVRRHGGGCGKSGKCFRAMARKEKAVLESSKSQGLWQQRR